MNLCDQTFKKSYNKEARKEMKIFRYYSNDGNNDLSYVMLYEINV